MRTCRQPRSRRGSFNTGREGGRQVPLALDRDLHMELFSSFSRFLKKTNKQEGRGGCKSGGEDRARAQRKSSLSASPAPRRGFRMEADTLGEGRALLRDLSPSLRARGTLMVIEERLIKALFAA